MASGPCQWPTVMPPPAGTNMDHREWSISSVIPCEITWYITNYTTQNSHITKTEGMYSIIRKKLYNKNICYTAYMVYNKLIYIYINVY